MTTTTLSATSFIDTLALDSGTIDATLENVMAQTQTVFGHEHIIAGKNFSDSMRRYEVQFVDPAQNVHVFRTEDFRSEGMINHITNILVFRDLDTGRELTVNYDKIRDMRENGETQRNVQFERTIIPAEDLILYRDNFAQACARAAKPNTTHLSCT